MNKSFKISLIISLISHSLLFFPLNGISFTTKNKNLKPIEITYISTTQKKSKKSVSAYKKPTDTTKKIIKKVLPLKPHQDKINTKIQVVKKLQEPKELIKEKNESKKDIKKLEVKSMIDKSLMKSKNYINYYQLLRAKIKNYVTYPKSVSQGEVYLSFTLNPDGQLKIIKINEKGSSSDALLRLAALESIKKANPFPPFPTNFKKKEAVFNVIISFEIK